MCPPPLQHVARNVAEVESTSATLRATNYVVLLVRASQLRAISFMGGHTLQQNCQQYCMQCCTVYVCTVSLYDT